MLTLWKSPRGSSQNGDSDSDDSFQEGRPYLTKVNGKLVMARSKRKKRHADSAMDLLGEAFGVPRHRPIHNRSRTVHGASSTEPVLIAGTPYAAQPIPLTHSTPLPQTGFMPMISPLDYERMQMQIQQMQMQMAQMQIPQLYPHLHPQQILAQQQTLQAQQAAQQVLQPQHLQSSNSEQTRYTVDTTSPKPTKQDFEDLVRIDAHFKSLEIDEKDSEIPLDASVQTKDLHPAGAPKLPVPVQKHVCAECGNIHSRKYHHDHPTKSGELPTPAFCRKCQKDATASESSENTKENKKGRAKSDTLPKANEKEKQRENTDAQPKLMVNMTDAKDSKKPKEVVVVPAAMEDYDSLEDNIVVEEEILEEEQPAKRSFGESVQGRQWKPPRQASTSDYERRGRSRQEFRYAEKPMFQERQKARFSSRRNREEAPDFDELYYANRREPRYAEEPVCASRTNSRKTNEPIRTSSLELDYVGEPAYSKRRTSQQNEPAQVSYYTKGVTRSLRRKPQYTHTELNSSQPEFMDGPHRRGKREHNDDQAYYAEDWSRSQHSRSEGSFFADSDSTTHFRRAYEDVHQIMPLSGDFGDMDGLNPHNSNLPSSPLKSSKALVASQALGSKDGCSSYSSLSSSCSINHHNPQSVLFDTHSVNSVEALHIPIRKSTGHQQFDGIDERNSSSFYSVENSRQKSFHYSSFYEDDNDDDGDWGARAAGTDSRIDENFGADLFESSSWLGGTGSAEDKSGGKESTGDSAEWRGKPKEWGNLSSMAGLWRPDGEFALPKSWQ